MERLLTEQGTAAQREVAEDATRLLSEANHLVNALDQAASTRIAV